MATIEPLINAISPLDSVPWTAAQEKSISTEFPFEPQPVDIEDHITRTYLQFLWLPESIMPLNLLIPALKRVSPSSLSDPHPAHALLATILLEHSVVTSKYRVELPQILENGGGAGEMEECMMWFAVENENPLDSQNQSTDKWLDPAWKQNYLTRMERREVQIQILLYFYKLSLPGPEPPPPTPQNKKKRKRRQRVYSDSDSEILSTHDHLESYMDKLSTWQLLDSLERNPTSALPKDKGKKKDERDWMQIFCEDIVEKEFEADLPEVCALLRSKVFPSSPFSDSEETQDLARKPSVEPLPGDKLRTLSRNPSLASFSARDISPALPSTSRAPSLSQPKAVSHTHTLSRSRSQSQALTGTRSRSQSLSQSLIEAQAQEELDRANNLHLHAPQNRKRVPLGREISMSRVFKAKPILVRDDIPNAKSVVSKDEQSNKAKERNTGVTLVEDTPIRPRVGIQRTKTELILDDKPETLVEETPTKPKVRKTLSTDGMAKIPAPTWSFGTELMSPLTSIQSQDESEPAGDSEEEWMVDSSPNIVLFNPRPTITLKVSEDKSKAKTKPLVLLQPKSKLKKTSKPRLEPSVDESREKPTLPATPSKPARKRLRKC